MKPEPLASLDEILPVLTGCDLPVADISAASPPLFFGFRMDGSLAAVVGLELFDSVGLLRSLAVLPGYRGHGFARKLVTFAEAFAAARGVESLYLLTTSAEPFFAKLGYCHATRQDAPHAIQTTSQFSGLCPSSAAFLSKNLTAG